MRVLHVNTFAEPIGGAELYIRSLSAELRAAGHAVGLFAASSKEPSSTPETRVIMRPDWDGATLLRDATLEAAFLEHCAKFRPEVIHIHNFHTFPVMLIARLAELGIPTVQTIHDAGLFCANSWLVHADGKVCAGGVGTKCSQHGCEKNYPYDGRVLTSIRMRIDALRDIVDGWIAPSNFFANLAAQHGLSPVQKIMYFCGKVQPEQPERASSRRILFAGRLVREKGLEYLIRAWPAVLSTHPDAELFIAGDGPQRAELEGLCSALGLQPGRILRGKVPHAQVEELMLDSSALVLPSVWVENSPLACYEALTVGLPMIASDIGGLSDLVIPDKTGWLVPPRDAGALSSAICASLSGNEPWLNRHRGCLQLAGSLTKQAHMDAILAAYRAAQARGTARRKQPDTDLIDSTDKLFQQFTAVERWALDMKKHIEYLEGIGRADQPVKSFARHMKFWLKSKNRR